MFMLVQKLTASFKILVRDSKPGPQDTSTKTNFWSRGVEGKALLDLTETPALLLTSDWRFARWNSYVLITL